MVYPKRFGYSGYGANNYFDSTFGSNGSSLISAGKKILGSFFKLNVLTGVSSTFMKLSLPGQNREPMAQPFLN